MSQQLMLNLVAAALGLVGGSCFCVGSAFSGTKTLADLCESAWGYSPAQAKARALQ